MEDIVELRKLEFDARQIALELRRAMYEHGEFDKAGALADAERALAQIGDQRSAAEAQSGVGQGKILAKPQQSNLLGPQTTGLTITVDLRMASIPTSLVHLFDAESHPLVLFRIGNSKQDTKRLRLISYVEGYSAQSVETVEVEQLRTVEVKQLPTFFPDRLAIVTELTRASLNIEVQDLDARTELHKTVPVWMLARTTAPLRAQDPATGAWLDMTDYLGAYVTPNAPAVMEYLRIATDKHPQKRLVGYQVSADEVTSEVKAIFDALASSQIRYVNSIIDFTPEKRTANQRVRLPRESLSNTSANCIDGTTLMASLLEAVSLNPAIVIVPGHAFLGWETGRNSNNWNYVETTMIGTGSFEAACVQGKALADLWSNMADKTQFKRMSLRELRAKGITPLE